MLFDLSGRVALVTGATGHLGTEMCRALGESGATVLVNSRCAERAAALVAELKSTGFSAESAPFDVRDASAVKAFADGYRGGALHVLINNAYAGGGGTVETSSPSDFREAYDLAVTAAHTVLQTLLPMLRRGRRTDGDASVVNIASMYGLVSPDQRVYDTPEGTNPPFYGAAKAALVQYTRYAACEFGPEGLRVNAVAPGPLPARPVQLNAPAFVDALASKVPLRRIGQAAEIGGPVVFLASPAASFVTGAVLAVDGGWTAW